VSLERFGATSRTSSTVMFKMEDVYRTSRWEGEADYMSISPRQPHGCPRAKILILCEAFSSFDRISTQLPIHMFPADRLELCAPTDCSTCRRI